MSALSIALAGGVIGSVVTAVLTQFGRGRIAWGEVSLHDEESNERNDRLVVWVDDRTRALFIEMTRLANDYNSRGQFHRGACGAGLAEAKAEALHEYRDQEWLAKIDLARLRAREGRGIRYGARSAAVRPHD